MFGKVLELLFALQTYWCFGGKDLRDFSNCFKHLLCLFHHLSSATTLPKFMLCHWNSVDFLKHGIWDNHLKAWMPGQTCYVWPFLFNSHSQTVFCAGSCTTSQILLGLTVATSKAEIFFQQEGSTGILVLGWVRSICCYQYTTVVTNMSVGQRHSLYCKALYYISGIAQKVYQMRVSGSKQ